MDIPADRLPSHRVLELRANENNLQVLEALTKALASDTRLGILRFLGTHTCNLLEIAEALNLPPSTAAMHINVLERAGLIPPDLLPAKRGLPKIAKLTNIISSVIFKRILTKNIPKEYGGVNLISSSQKSFNIFFLNG